MPSVFLEIKGSMPTVSQSPVMACDVQFVHTAMRPLSAEVPRGRGCISLK